jgi:hypothetical protein
MRILTEQEKIALKEDQLQAFKVVVLTDNSEYNLTYFRGFQARIETWLF